MAAQQRRIPHRAAPPRRGIEQTYGATGARLLIEKTTRDVSEHPDRAQLHVDVLGEQPASRTGRRPRWQARTVATSSARARRPLEPVSRAAGPS